MAFRGRVKSERYKQADTW